MPARWRNAKQRERGQVLQKYNATATHMSCPVLRLLITWEGALYVWGYVYLLTPGNPSPLCGPKSSCGISVHEDPEWNRWPWETVHCELM